MRVSFQYPSLTPNQGVKFHFVFLDQLIHDQIGVLVLKRTLRVFENKTDGVGSFACAELLFVFVDVKQVDIPDQFLADFSRNCRNINKIYGIINNEGEIIPEKSN